MQAKDVMTGNVISVSESTEVHDIVRILLENKISAVPVVDDAENVVGMLSEGDLLVIPQGDADTGRPWWLTALSAGQAIDFAKARGRTAGEVMTRHVVHVEEDTPLSEIAALFAQRRIKHAPVVRDGKLRGIISRANLLHGLADTIVEQHEPGATQDRALRAHVIDALAHASPLDTHLINVTVRDGAVKLWGEIDDAAQRKAAERAARATPGVKSVQNNLQTGPVSGVPI